MKKILILGAGRVVKPMIDYFFEHTNYMVTIAGLDVAKNLQFLAQHPRGNLEKLNINDNETTQKKIQEHDIVVSLLPAHLHYGIACVCLENNKNLVTASYVDEKMQSLNKEVSKKGLLFLNEIGLDPGIDHILAKYMIDTARERGGKIISYYSYCGGLPAPSSNNNPVGYKFSWSPMGVMSASKNGASFLKNGQIVTLENKNVFQEKTHLTIDGMQFFAYANRDSLKYKKLYNLENAQNLMRGTLRYPGWCEFIEGLLCLDLLSDTTKISAKTPLTYMEKYLNSKDISEQIKNKLKNKTINAFQHFEWLEIFSTKELLPNQDMSPIEFIVELCQQKMQYQEDEKDMVVLHNVLEVEYSNKVEHMEMTLVDLQTTEETAMARTVSLPAAIATELILEKKVIQTGIKIPISKSIYQPMIKRLEKLGISLSKNF